MKKQIKVIKREERAESLAARSTVKQSSARKKREAAKRDPVAIVTEWIGDLRRKKEEDTAQPFESLFDSAS